MIEALEDSGIAWPNRSMWYQAPQQLFNVSSPQSIEAVNLKMDIHSPCGRSLPKFATCQQVAMSAACPESSHDFMPVPSLGSRELLLEKPSWTSLSTMLDPFIDDGGYCIHKTDGGQATLEDQTMPDFYHSVTPASSQSSSNYHNIMHIATLGGLAPPESQFDELMASLSPRKDSDSGTFAPTNTRANSAANTPPTRTEHAAAAEAADFSYSQGICQPSSVTPWDPSLTLTGEPWTTGARSCYAESAWESMERYGAKARKGPAKDVKGRKEGMDNGHGPPVRAQKRTAADPARCHDREHGRGSGENPVLVSDGKRKRVGKIPASRLPIKDGDDTSPTRQMSKAGSFAELTEDTYPAMRAPLGTLTNL